MNEQNPVTGWRRPELLLLLMAAAVPLSFATWSALINNFAHEQAGFTGVEIGTMQSLREIPGFLAFAVVFLLLLIREQPLALLSLLLLGIGTALTGFFPSVIGIYLTTVLMSVGYHYYETLQTSLSLQWIDKARAPETLGRLIAAGSFSSILVFGLIWLGSDLLDLGFRFMYLVGGGLTIAIAVFAWLSFPRFKQPVEQHKHMVIRKRYWLYYALTFMSGARRQIFMVFAGFLMVEKFGFDVGAIASLFLVNAAISIWLAPMVGRLIGKIGERSRADSGVCRSDRCVCGLRVCRQRGAGRNPLCSRPSFLCPCDRNQDLFSEDCGSGGHCIHRGGEFHHQPYRGGVHSGSVRLHLDSVSGGGLPCWRRNGEHLAGSCTQCAASPDRGQ